jgi:hypothetical protein
MTVFSGTPPRSTRTSARRLVAINLVVFAALLALVEIGARVAIFLTRGASTTGLPERTLSLTYEPFVMYGPEWDRQFTAADANDRRPIALLLGGSTAQGFSPEILGAALQRRFGRPVHVVNAAYGGYEARQEVVVASLWAPQLRPSVIISLDGQNDLEHRLRVARPGRFFLDAAYQTYLTRPFLAPVAYLLAESQAYNAVARLSARHHIADWTHYADAIPVYVAAQHSINVVARGLGAKRLIVLQPFMSFKQPLAPEERAFTAYAYRDGVMRALYDHAAPALAELAREDAAEYLDARAIFNGIASAVFSDDVHFRGDGGYARLAQVIADALPPDTFDGSPK